MSEKIDTNTTQSEYAVVARMNELGIKLTDLGDKCAYRVAHGMMVAIETARTICNRLDAVYDDLFTTIQHKNHHIYALPKLVDGTDGPCGINGYIDTDINKSEEKPKRPIHPAQSACSQCGHLSIRFRERDGILMCARCADIPRCADCHTPANLLYVVEGRMICPRCESRMRQRENEQMEQRQMEATK